MHPSPTGHGDYFAPEELVLLFRRPLEGQVLVFCYHLLGHGGHWKPSAVKVTACGVIITTFAWDRSKPSSRGQAVEQLRAGVAPVPVGGGARDAEYRGGFLDR